MNAEDNAEVISQYVKEGGFSFPIVLNGEGKNDINGKYGVLANPTNIVLTPADVVVNRYIGYRASAIKADLEKLGIAE